NGPETDFLIPFIDCSFKQGHVAGVAAPKQAHGAGSVKRAAGEPAATGRPLQAFNQCRCP
ncbi:MAG: hypothetical protein ACPH9E_00620, partial [Hyphomonas sp.]